MPVHGLYELQVLLGKLEERLQDVHCPTLVLQADRDPVVDPNSATTIMNKLGSENKRLEMIASERHGILYGDVGDTRKLITEYLHKL
jgi:esterase/lipase